MNLRTLETRIIRKAFRNFFYPNLQNFEEIGNIYIDIYKIYKAIFNYDNKFKSLKLEYKKIADLIKKRYKEVNLNYPLNFAVENESGFLIYCIIRTIKPLHVVETGVANGHSSFIILKAMERNNLGKLFSIDISNNVGGLLTQNMKNRWELIVTQPKKAKFREVFKNLPKTDVFLHDSNHSFSWQKFEYKLFLSRLSKGGFILSDDINDSYAFYDFIKEKNKRAYILYDYRKFFGITRL